MFLRLPKTSEGPMQREVPPVPLHTCLWLLLCPLQPHGSDAFCCEHSKGELALQLMASKVKAQLWWHREKLSTSPSKDDVLLTALGSAFFLAFCLVLLLFCCCYYCLLVLHFVSLQSHQLRKSLVYLVALSILEGPSTPEGRSWVLFCFVLFLNSTNNRRNDYCLSWVHLLPCTRVRCFVFPSQPPLSFYLGCTYFVVWWEF